MRHRPTGSGSNRLRRHAAAFLFSGLAAALADLALFSWLAERVFEGSTHGIDLGTRAFVQKIASPGLTFAMLGFSVLGEGLSLAALAAIGIAFLWRAGRKQAAWLLAITMAGAGLLDQMLKILFHRPRPQPFFHTPLPASYSFPSGHALVSCCLFGVLAAMLTVREPRRGRRIALWTAAALLAAVIGFSRVYLGVHYATDVIAGYAAAVVWVFAVEAVYKLGLRNRAQARHL